MAKRIKPDHLKAKSRTITIPQSFNTFVKNTNINLSKAAQVYIAEQVTGMKFTEFEAMYATQEARSGRNHPHDSIVVEFIRVARWMLEGTVKSVEAIRDLDVSQHDNHQYVTYVTRLGVQWFDCYTEVKITSNQAYFKHVLYDEVIDEDTIDDDFEYLEDDSIVSEDICYIEGAPLKGILLARWVELSKERGAV